MKWTAFLFAILLLPIFALADAGATSICVLDTPTYEKLLKEYGETAKIPTGELWAAAVHRGFIKESYDSTFKREDHSYRLLAARQGTQVIYSVSEGEEKLSRLLCVGTVGLDEAKKDRGSDPYVVVLRTGNFLLK